MKTKFKLLVILLLSAIASIPVFASNHASDELKNCLIELSKEQLEDLGIFVKGNSVEMIAMDIQKNSKSANDKMVIRQINIKGDRINIRTPVWKGKVSPILFPLRMAVLQSKNMSASYFSKITEVDANTIANPNIIAENTWKAIIIHLDNDRDLYLWFDPKDIKSKQDITDNSSEQRQDAEFMRDIVLFPNPTTNGKSELKFYLVDDATLTISIFDISGRNVGSVLANSPMKFGTQSCIINCEDLPDGMYLIHIKNEKGEVISKKLIKTVY